MFLRIPLFFLFISVAVSLGAQKRNPFNSYLPIMESSSISWRSPMNNTEDLVFDLQPTLYYQFYNTYADTSKTSKQAVYANFKSHIRMFQEQSLPVKTPSYKAFLGYQHSFNWSKNVLHIALETGHYSNGQSSCAWDASVADGSDACKAAYREINDETDLAEIYNRNSGNFSINLTQLIIQFVIPRIKEPKMKDAAIAHRFTLTLGRNDEAFAFVFDFSGKEDDIQFVGDNFIKMETESFFSPNDKIDFSLKNELEYVNGVHASINPWRYTFSVNVFPLEWVTAFYMAYTTGHDNYNYRIVDSGNQFSVGVRWDLFDRNQYK
ncbi:MAG: hypothetical protein RJQ00_05190 [Vicingaceae bacterium]